MSLEQEIDKLYQVKVDITKRYYESVMLGNEYAKKVILITYEEIDKLIKSYEQKAKEAKK
jgi:hypothetical protein